MSGTSPQSPFLGFGSPDAQPLFPDAINQPDALMQTVTNVRNWLAAQRAKSAQMGLWNDQTGLPTQAGVTDAARQMAGNFVGDITAYHGSPHSFDQFDASKIGMGEGNQAQGRGLYFAGNENVARGYRDALTQPGAAGSMYQVNLKAEPEQLLDWDKPLNQQSPEVTNAIKNSMYAGYADTNLPGSQLAPSTAEGADAMAAIGIPGIKYSDSQGQGSNYVMFDPKSVEILRKYGMLATLGAGAGSAAAQSPLVPAPIDAP